MTTIQKNIGLLLALCLCFSSVKAAELIVNGNFETGDLSGWAVELQPESLGGWVVYSGTTLPYSGSDFFHPPGELHGAAFDQIGPASSVLYQDVAIPKGTATLTFTYYYQDYDTVHTLDYHHKSSQQFRVDIVDIDAHPFSIASEDVLANVFELNSVVHSSQEPTIVTYDLKPFCGQTIRLRFAAVNHEGTFKVGVDDISISTCKSKSKKK